MEIGIADEVLQATFMEIGPADAGLRATFVEIGPADAAFEQHSMSWLNLD